MVRAPWPGVRRVNSRGGPEPSAGPRSASVTRIRAHVHCQTKPSIETVWGDLLPRFRDSAPLEAALPGTQATTPNGAQLSPGDPVLLSVWNVLLRNAQFPEEAARNDTASRARSRFVHGVGRGERGAAGADRPDVDLHRQAWYHARKGRKEQALTLLYQGMERFPGNAYFPQSAAVLCARQGRNTEAQELYQKALQIDPQNSPAYVGLARLKEASGDADQARRDYRSAAQAKATNASAWNSWAKFERRCGNTRRAKQLLLDSLKHCPDHEPTLHSLAHLELSQNHFKQARQYLLRSIELNPAHAHAWTTLGQLCYVQGDVKQARRMFQSGAKFCGDDAVMYSSWAGMELRMADVGRARVLLERSLELDPANVHSWVQLACITARDPHLRPNAVATWRRAFEVAPTSVHLQHAFAQFLLQQCGMIQQAEALLYELRKRVPNNATVARTLGIILVSQGDRRGAAAIFKQGLEADKTVAALLCCEELARLAELEGRGDVAQRLYQRHCQQRRPTVRSLREWALLERRMGNVDQARVLFEQAVEVASHDVRTWTAWALLERSCKQYDRALHLLQQAVIIGPKVRTVWYLYLQTALQCLPVQECREIYREARKCVPKAPQIVLLSALMEWRSGNMPAAKQLFKLGSSLSDGTSEYYVPLFEAWAQFEAACGDSKASQRIMSQAEAVKAREKSSTQKTRVPNQRQWIKSGVLDVLMGI